MCTHRPFITAGWEGWGCCKVAHWPTVATRTFNTSRPNTWQALCRRHIQRYFLERKYGDFDHIEISLEFVLKGPINNNPVLFQVMTSSRQATRHFLHKCWRYMMSLGQTIWTKVMILIKVIADCIVTAKDFHLGEIRVDDPAVFADTCCCRHTSINGSLLDEAMVRSDKLGNQIDLSVQR